jgi:hypothetical protein
MENNTNSRQRLVDFRLEVYASFTLRADALFELVDALLHSPIVRSAVEVSQSPVFRRRFASVYDALTEGKIDPAALRDALAAAEPPDALTVAGYAVYALDTTIAPRPDAATVPDRSRVYSAAHDKAIAGHQFSWLGRVIAFGQSWFASREVVRVPTSRTSGEIGAEQDQRLAAGLAPRVVLLARLASNRVLYGSPPVPTGKRGRPPVHGVKLSLRTPSRPDRQETARVGGQDVRISAWANYHLRAVPTLVGVVVRAEFLTADGTPRYQRPLWLFWSGPPAIALADVVTMYLLRFTIEHFFRFLKQRLGLLAAHLGDLRPIETWVQVVALAYWQLLLARALVQPAYRPWDPTARQDPNRPLTPGQVLAAWPIFSRTVETPAAAPKRTGKAPGRAPGERPKPRERHPVAKARKPQVKMAA